MTFPDNGNSYVPREESSDSSDTPLGKDGAVLATFESTDGLSVGDCVSICRASNGVVSFERWVVVEVVNINTARIRPPRANFGFVQIVATEEPDDMDKIMKDRSYF